MRLIDGTTRAPVLDTPAICPTLIGRTRERATLYALMEAITYGAGRAAIISGEAGIGKSRLIADAKRVALIRGLDVAQGQCFQADAKYPYASLLDLLRTFLPTHLPAITAAGQEPLVREIVQLLPDLALVFPQFAQSDSPQPTNHANYANRDSPDPERQKRRIMSILTHLLVEQTAQKPLALMIEDIHWCDESTLDFLLHLARHTTHTPLFLLFTLRRSEDIPPHMGHWLSQLSRERLAVELELARLSPAEVGAMAQAILATRSLKRSKIIKVICTLTEGNPFFVEEVLKSLITSGDLRVVDGKWTWKYTRSKPGEGSGASLIPSSVQGAIQQQIARLSADAQQAVTLAAVVGRRFDFTVLQRLMACDEGRLIHLIKELIAAQFVVEESADLFAFRHALIQQAIVGVLLARERRSLHLAVADALESLFTTPPQREAHLADLASHFYLAGDWAKTLEYS